MLRSDRPLVPKRRRDSRRGVILLEVLVAFALMAAVVILGLRTMSSAALSDDRRVRAYWLAEYARSKAEEYTVSRHLMDKSGAEDEGWTWQITEKVVKPDGENRFDADIELREVTINVGHARQPGIGRDATTIVAVRP